MVSNAFRDCASDVDGDGDVDAGCVVLGDADAEHVEGADPEEVDAEIDVAVTVRLVALSKLPLSEKKKDFSSFVSAIRE